MSERRSGWWWLSRIAWLAVIALGLWWTHRGVRDYRLHPVTSDEIDGQELLHSR